MTDHPDPQDERAERALRDAFAQHADALEPAPLVARGRRRRWPLLVAGAAALAVVAVTATFAVIDADDDRGDPAPAAATADDATTDPTPGTRTVGYRDLELEVPDAWADAPMPSLSGCDYPSEPFVARYDPAQAFELMDCTGGRARAPEGFPTAKRAQWTPNVQLRPTVDSAESLPDGREELEGWTLTRATVGGIRIEVLTDAATDALVDAILASARTVETDANGCDTTSPAQAAEFVRPPAFDVTEVDDVTTIAVCQYVRGDTTTPGLTASTLLTGEDAQTELAAIQDAPAGGGPDEPENCVPDQYGDSALVLRLTADDTAPRDLHVYYDWCFGNGIDDGTTTRELTADSCRPLFATPVTIASGQQELFERCHHPHGS